MPLAPGTGTDAPQYSGNPAVRAWTSDAHAPKHLEFDAYACAIAMKAKVPREQILNVMHADEFEVWLGDR